MVDVDALLTGSFDQEWLEAQAESVVLRLSEVGSSSYTLVTLIDSLGPVLTHSSTSTRLAGLTIVSHVLANPTIVLHQEDTSLMLVFYLDRLRDHHSLLPVTLYGISSLAKMHNLGRDQLERLLHSLYSEVMVQQQVVKDRAVVFTMLSHLLRNRTEDIKALATQFTVGFLQAFEGEKDPRNLLLIFSTVSSMLNILPINHLVEDVFESLAVYFPVDFTPPSGLSGSVTKQQLVEGLREGLSHPDLTEWTIGLLLEKLESDLESAKIDSLETLIKLVQRFATRQGDGMDIWAREVYGIWSALKRETMGIRLQPSKQVVELANDAVREVSKLLGNVGGLDTPEQSLAWSRWIDAVWDDCKSGLGQPSTRLMVLSGQVLGQVVGSGRKQAGHILDLAMPTLIATWEQQTGPEARKAIMLVMGSLLEQGAHVSVEIGADMSWLDLSFTIFLSVITRHELDGAGVGPSIDIAKAAGILSITQQTELMKVLVDGVKRGEVGMGTALAYLSQWNSKLVEAEVPKLLDESNHGVEAVCRLWSAGLYGKTVPGLVERLVESRLSPEQSNYLLGQMGEYSLSEEDKKLVEPQSLMCKLLGWTGRREFAKLGQVMARLAELLTQHNCEKVGGVIASLDITKDRDILCCIVSGLSAEVLEKLPHLVENVINIEDDEEQIWKLKASIVNKVPKSTEQMSVPDNRVGWICVGLSMRGDGLASAWLERLVNQLSSPSGMEAAAMLGKLLEPCWFAQPVVGLLYRQRIWAQLKPLLIGSQETGDAHLAGLVLLMPHLPVQLLHPSLPVLLPLLVRALTLPSTTSAALTCLQEITRSSPDLVSSHLSEVIHHCLELSKTSALPDRVLALTVLGSCTSLEGPVPVQLAPKVKKELTFALKDKKRVVRMEAARVRNKWFLVTQPA